MPRLSNIKEFLGGADNVLQIEVLQGEQHRLTGVLRNTANNALDISGYTLEVATEFYHGTVSTGARSSAVSSLDLFESTDPNYDANSLGEATVAITDGPNGVFQLTIPENLYELDIPADIDGPLPIAVIYVRYSDGTPGAANTSSRVNRFMVIIRRSRF